MLSEFAVYSRLGLEHILDPRGYDHILFVVALTVVYAPAQWRAVLVQVTAFTVGHSVTLALATLNLVRMPSSLVEALIPLTILLTAGVHVVGTLTAGRGSDDEAWGLPDPGAPPRSAATQPGSGWAMSPWTWSLAAGFGLIHGLGFSNFLRALLGSGGELLGPLFAFNVGLEAGQVVVVLATLSAGVAAHRWLGVGTTVRVRAVGGAIMAVAVYLLIQRLPF